jgi:chromosomal replication initiation ATPase DnaA
MFTSIYAMDPKAPPPRREQATVKRVNIVSEQRARDERQARLDAAEADRREQTRQIIAAAKAQAELIVSEAQSLAAVITAEAVAEVEARPPSVMDIIKAMAEKHGVSVAEIKGKRRNRHITVARQEAMALAYEQRPDLALPQIGRVFGRDHTTVLYAVQKSGKWRAPGLPRGEGSVARMRAFPTT